MLYHTSFINEIATMQLFIFGTCSFNGRLNYK